MDVHHLNALRLGFTTKDAGTIASVGVQAYIRDQLGAQNFLTEPSFIKESPKTFSELKELKNNAVAGGKALEKAALPLRKIHGQWKAFILQRCYETKQPLREKINLFFQNHFVATLQSVKIPYWIFKYYESINTHALGNYKTLVCEMVYSNALIKYLDNQQNRRGNINENLARELLELFTLGEGNYSENDIKNTALALAGLSLGEERGQYRPRLKDDSVKTVFGKSGNFIIDDVIEIIFQQKNTSYLLAEKVLKWFFYDHPTRDKVIKYGDLLREKGYELKPFFQSVFEAECKNEKGGQQIKNPLTWIFQVFQDLRLEPNYTLISFFLKTQAMDVFDQPNVKGWKGGQHWLTSQIYEDRNRLIDFLVNGNERFQKALTRRLEKFDVGLLQFKPSFNVNDKKNAQTILDEMINRLVFEADDQMRNELNQLLRYDFDPNAENADKSILQVYAYLTKSPEFQII